MSTEAVLHALSFLSGAALCWLVLQLPIPKRWRKP